jgi:major membrane immunogen (membrane-anchored lipoprotein)
MKTNKIKRLAIIALVSLSLLISACGRIEFTKGGNNSGNIAGTGQPTQYSIEYVK